MTPLGRFYRLLTLKYFIGLVCLAYAGYVLLKLAMVLIIGLAEWWLQGYPY